MKLSKKVGRLLTCSTAIIAIIISAIFGFIYYKLNQQSVKIIINYNMMFFIILFSIIISNIFIYIFINNKIIKRIKYTEESIDKVISHKIEENEKSNKYDDKDEITRLNNEINSVVDKLVHTESYLEEEEKNYSNILNTMSNSFFHLKSVEDENGQYVDGIIVDINYAAIDFLEKSKDEIVNYKLSEIYKNFNKHQYEIVQVLNRIDKSKSECITNELNITNDKWGVVSIYSLGKGFFSIIINDVTEIKKHSKEMEYLASYDTLTNLVNRHNLFEYLIELISRNEECTVYFIDLDDFKNINDTLGHNTGDEVLRIVADRLLELAFSCDDITVGRLGGDEFLVVKRGKSDIKQNKELAEKILKLLSKKIEFSRYKFSLKSSIGISSYPSDADDVFTLIKYADISMYQGKEEGGNRYKVFSEEMLEELELQSRLSSAIDRNEFEVYYQPIYDVTKEKVVGAEALTRWNSSDGLISPVKYIPLAKKSGDIIKLDEFVLRESCKCCKRMYELGEENFRVSINISYSAIKQVDFIDKLTNIIDEVGVTPKSIKLEITEDEIIEKLDFVVSVLEKVRALGFKIALDDFGVGYSSFNYIKSLPLDTLKIDRSLLISLEKDGKTLAIMETLINLSHTLDLDVVCEGVEINNQLELLKNIKCDKIQGFYISKPINFNSFKDFIINFNKINI